MKVAFDSKTEKRIRASVKPGDLWALDELTEEICGDDSELRREFSEIVADETKDNCDANHSNWRKFAQLADQEVFTAK